MTNRPNQFPLDLTGASPRNLIRNEVREVRTQPTRIFVPSGGVYYSSTMIIHDKDTGRRLMPVVDYKCLHLDVDASFESGKQCCSVVIITNESVSNVRFDYQVVGGRYADTVAALRTLLEGVDFNTLNRISWGTQVYNKPETYPAAAHRHPGSEFGDWKRFHLALNNIYHALQYKDHAAWESIYEYINGIIESSGVKGFTANYYDKVEIERRFSAYADDFLTNDKFAQAKSSIDATINLINSAMIDLNSEYDKIKTVVDTLVARKPIGVSPDSGNLLELRANGFYYGIEAPADLTNIYVDAINGSDDNPGTKAEPFKTLDKALNVSPPENSNTIRLKCIPEDRQEDVCYFMSKRYTITNGAVRTILPYGHTAVDGDEFKRINALDDGRYDPTYTNTFPRPAVRLKRFRLNFGTLTRYALGGFNIDKGGALHVRGVDIFAEPLISIGEGAIRHNRGEFNTFAYGDGSIHVIGCGFYRIVYGADVYDWTAERQESDIGTFFDPKWTDTSFTMGWHYWSTRLTFRNFIFGWAGNMNGTKILLGRPKPARIFDHKVMSASSNMSQAIEFRTHDEAFIAVHNSYGFDINVAERSERNTILRKPNSNIPFHPSNTVALLSHSLGIWEPRFVDRICINIKSNIPLYNKDKAQNLVPHIADSVYNQHYKPGDIFQTTQVFRNSNEVKEHHGYGHWIRFAPGSVLLGSGNMDRHDPAGVIDEAYVNTDKSGAYGVAQVTGVTNQMGTPHNTALTYPAITIDRWKRMVSGDGYNFSVLALAKFELSLPTGWVVNKWIDVNIETLPPPILAGITRIVQLTNARDWSLVAFKIGEYNINNGNAAQTLDNWGALHLKFRWAHLPLLRTHKLFVDTLDSLAYKRPMSQPRWGYQRNISNNGEFEVVVGFSNVARAFRAGETVTAAPSTQPTLDGELAKIEFNFGGKSKTKSHTYGDSGVFTLTPVTATPGMGVALGTRDGVSYIVVNLPSWVDYLQHDIHFDSAGSRVNVLWDYHKFHRALVVIENHHEVVGDAYRYRWDTRKYTLSIKNRPIHKEYVRDNNLDRYLGVSAGHIAKLHDRGVNVYITDNNIPNSALSGYYDALDLLYTIPAHLAMLEFSFSAKTRYEVIRDEELELSIIRSSGGLGITRIRERSSTSAVTEINFNADLPSWFDPFKHDIVYDPGGNDDVSIEWYNDTSTTDRKLRLFIRIVCDEHRDQPHEVSPSGWKYGNYRAVWFKYIYKIFVISRPRRTERDVEYYNSQRPGRDGFSSGESNARTVFNNRNNYNITSAATKIGNILKTGFNYDYEVRYNLGYNFTLDKLLANTQYARRPINKTSSSYRSGYQFAILDSTQRTVTYEVGDNAKNDDWVAGFEAGMADVRLGKAAVSRSVGARGRTNAPTAPPIPDKYLEAQSKPVPVHTADGKVSLNEAIANSAKPQSNQPVTIDGEARAISSDNPFRSGDRDFIHLSGGGLPPGWSWGNPGESNPTITEDNLPPGWTWIKDAAKGGTIVVNDTMVINGSNHQVTTTSTGTGSQPIGRANMEAGKRYMFTCSAEIRMGIYPK